MCFFQWKKESMTVICTHRFYFIFEGGRNASSHISHGLADKQWLTKMQYQLLTLFSIVCLLFGNTAFQSNMSEQTEKTAFPREGKDAACLVSHWLILPFLDSWIWLSYSTYHRIQNKFARVRGPARPTVAAAVPGAGYPLQHRVTGTAHPALLHCGLFPVPPAQGKKGRNNHFRANSWQRCPAWGQAGRGSP